MVAEGGGLMMIRRNTRMGRKDGGGEVSKNHREVRVMFSHTTRLALMQGTV